MVDYSGGEAMDIINKYKNNFSDVLIDEIINFIAKNPNYGDDGNGIWFE